MDILSILTTIIAVSTLNIACFFIGAKVGQKVVKGETLVLPSLNPAEAIKEHNSRKEAERQQKRDEIILRNIEQYDGTPFGQEEVPRG